MALRISRRVLKARRTRLAVFAAACVAIGAVAASMIIPERFSNAAAVQRVDCSTDPSVFNTGYVAATGSVAANGAADERWTVAGGNTGYNYGSGGANGNGNAPTGPISPALPPAGATFASSFVGKVNNGWTDSPFHDAQWISTKYSPPATGSNQATGWGDFYYQYEFDLAPEVNPATFQLKMDWYADNTVRGVWVNSSLKASTLVKPYFGENFLADKQVRTTLSGFVTGRNTIVVEVGSSSPALGFLAQVTSTALCPSVVVGKNVASRADASDQFVVAAKDAMGTTVASATTTGSETRRESAKAFVVANKPYTITDTLAAGSASPQSLYRGELVCTNRDTGAQLPVTGSAPSWTVTFPTYDDYACDVTNSSRTFSVSKKASTAVAQPGDTVTYSVTVTNTGTTAFTANEPASFTDDLSALTDDATYNNDATSGATITGTTLSWSGPLAVGDTATITYSFTVGNPVKGDGHLTNVVTGGPSCTVACSSTVTTDVRSYTVAKKVSSDAVSPGDTVTYTLTAKNTGVVAYTAAEPASFTDDLSRVLDDAVYNGDATNGAVVTGNTLAWSGPLAVGETVTVTYSVKVRAPVPGDKGLSNAIVPTAPGGACAAAGGCQTGTLVSVPALQLTKTADASTVQSPAAVGDTVTYSFALKNTGNVPLTGASITDPHPGLSALAYTWPTTPGLLAPNETVTAKATYKLTQADINTGHILNSATSRATPPFGPDVTSDASADVAIVATPLLALEKKADATALQSPARAGDTITYRFTATNTGNVTLTGVTLADPLPGLSPLDYRWPGAPGELAPGETVTATASYRVTQADIDSGEVSNTATVTATPPSGADVTDDGTADVPLPGEAAIDLEKSADSSLFGEPTAPGDVVTFTFVARNTGTVTLTDVTITDPLAGLSELTFKWPGTAGVLAPGESVTATAIYRLTQADLDAGHVSNGATTTARPPSGAPVGDDGSADVPITAVPKLELMKIADPSAVRSPAQAGDTIGFGFIARNSGTVTMTGVSITDPLPGLSPLTYEWPGTPGVLAPGESVKAAATYRLTQADIDAGHLSNSATTAGTPPAGPESTSPPAVTDTPLAPKPELTLTKAANGSARAAARPGDTVTYEFQVSNSGNVTITDVRIRDLMAGLSALEYSWPGAVGVLQPGQSVKATATYRLTQADIDSGHIANTATTTGATPAGPEVEAPPATADLPLASTVLPAVSG